ncbi:MAG: hypothetical protein M5U34_24955 [Chloroflexi bacterium]|nr:hypothetical protein [Chloroflexota bacterium]
MAIELKDPNELVEFIIHQGDDKDTPNDRSFDPSVTPEIWLIQGDETNYASRAEATGDTLVHYNRPDDIYTDWGLHLWQDGDPPLTTWPDREMPGRYDDFGAVYSITTDVYPHPGTDARPQLHHSQRRRFARSAAHLHAHPQLRSVGQC